MLELDAMARRSAPTTETATHGASATLEAVRRACRIIETRGAAGDGPVTLAELGRLCAMSPWHLQRVFTQAMGVSPRQYAEARRIERLKGELRRGEPVASATFGAGYGSSSRLYEKAGAELGMTPAAYKRGAPGARIAYGLARSPLGRLIAAATERGVCFVGLGDDDDRLEGELRRQFPAAETIEHDEGRMSHVLGAIVAHLDGRMPHLDLPLDIRATAFQRRVFEALKRIPLGETRSYREIAEAIGNPRASRAVGRACATNPVALVVPCHRVLREDGNLSGYRWGTGRKEALLKREKKESIAR
jgi:AraC family transcriptional regulator, regulatory protein of adaptative response / methylated-DNA-[protein]-cysteine methyltransferase